MIVLTMLMLSVVCYSAYTAKIVSELWNVPKPIRSLNGIMSYARTVYLLENRDTSYDVLEGLETRNPDLLRKIKLLSIDKIYVKLVSEPGRSCVITWPDAIISHVKESSPQNRTDVDAFLCRTFSSFTYQASASMFVPKGSELATLFNYR